MKQLRGICNLLLAILIATFILSCQSNIKDAPAALKKYSEYTDLEKMNLKLQEQNVELQERLDVVLKSKDLTRNEPSKDPLTGTIDSWKAMFSPTAAPAPVSQTTSDVAHSDRARAAPAAPLAPGPLSA